MEWMSTLMTPLIYPSDVTEDLEDKLDAIESIPWSPIHVPVLMTTDSTSIGKKRQQSGSTDSSDENDLDVGRASSPTHDGTHTRHKQTDPVVVFDTIDHSSISSHHSRQHNRELDEQGFVLPSSSPKHRDNHGAHNDKDVSCELESDIYSPLVHSDNRAYSPTHAWTETSHQQSDVVHRNDEQQLSKVPRPNSPTSHTSMHTVHHQEDEVYVPPNLHVHDDHVAVPWKP